MMINKRLISTVSESKKYIAGNVFFQWCSLAANITLMFAVTRFLQGVYMRTADKKLFLSVLIISAVSLFIRYLCITFASKMGYLSSKTVKKTLRELIYKKLLNLGVSYTEKVKTSEVVQVN